MKLDVKFGEKDQRFNVSFGEFQDISDGGYERGFAEGYANGEADGRASGLADGEQIGFADALAKRTELTVTENGEYTPEAESTGFSKVSVSLTSKLAQVVDKSVTEITEDDLAGVTKIGAYAFCKSPNLTRVVIPNSATIIEDRAFETCQKLSDVTFGNSVTSIGSYAFYLCVMTSLNIPDSVTDIKRSAFYGCYYIKSVVIGSGITSIGMEAFSSCSRMKSMTIKGGCSFLGACFENCSALENFSIGSFKLENNNFKLNYSPKLTVESMLNILNSAQDNTGEDATYTIYFGSTNLAKLTEEQKQIAYNKNIALA